MSRLIVLVFVVLVFALLVATFIPAAILAASPNPHRSISAADNHSTIGVPLHTVIYVKGNCASLISDNWRILPLMKGPGGPHFMARTGGTATLYASHCAGKNDYQVRVIIQPAAVK